MKKLLYFALAVLTLFCIGCSNNQADAPDPYASFVTDSVLSGGISLENANIQSIVFHEEDEDLRVDVTFSTGSRRSDGSEETAAQGVPSYSVARLTAPSRLVIRFDSIAYWDYERDMALGDKLIYGCFRESFAGSPGLNVYFQLDSDVSFYVEEQGDTLTLRLHPLEGADQEPAVEYFAMANAFTDYCAGVISREYQVSPVLCRDGTNVVLLSPGFSSQEEAEQFRREAVEACLDLSLEQWEIVALYHNDLPIYNQELDYRELYSRKAARIDGSEVALDILTPEGLYLCATPDGDGFLYSKSIHEQKVGTQETSEYEQLWLREMDGTEKELMRFEFSAIETASYSPDGRRLAVLEQAQEGAHLYVFDVDTNELLTDLSEIGFGNTISAFAWDDLGNTIYAVSGSSGIQVHQYDFTISEEGKRHSVVDKNGADESSIGICDGELYFVESSMEQGGVIYRIKPQGGVRREFLEGTAFAFSPDKRYLAVTTAGSDSMDTSKKDSFFLYDMQTGQRTQITSEFAVYDFLWDQNAKAVYFFENRFSGGQSEDELLGDQTQESEENSSQQEDTEEGKTQEEALQDPYPYVLYRYDLTTGETVQLADLPAPSVFVGEHELYIAYDETDEAGSRSRATYCLPLS